MPSSYDKPYSYHSVDYTIRGSEPFGKGAFGEVWKVREKKSGLSRAMKRIKIEERTLDEIVPLMKEVQILISTRHDNIVSLYGLNIEGGKYIELFLELASGSLDDLGKKKYFSDTDKPEDLYDMMVQTLEGLVYLHYKDILHRDLKPGNILYKETRRGHHYLLCDFGLSGAVAYDCWEGTRLYFAPERWSKDSQGRRREQNKANDVWSLAATFCDVLYYGEWLRAAKNLGGELATQSYIQDTRLQKLERMALSDPKARATAPEALSIAKSLTAPKKEGKREDRERQETGRHEKERHDKDKHEKDQDKERHERNREREQRDRHRERQNQVREESRDAQGRQSHDHASTHVLPSVKAYIDPDHRLGRRYTKHDKMAAEGKFDKIKESDSRHRLICSTVDLALRFHECPRGLEVLRKLGNKLVDEWDTRKRRHLYRAQSDNMTRCATNFLNTLRRNFPRVYITATLEARGMVSWNKYPSSMSTWDPPKSVDVKINRGYFESLVAVTKEYEAAKIEARKAGKDSKGAAERLHKARNRKHNAEFRLGSTTAHEISHMWEFYLKGDNGMNYTPPSMTWNRLGNPDSGELGAYWEGNMMTGRLDSIYEDGDPLKLEQSGCLIVLSIDNKHVWRFIAQSWINEVVAERKMSWPPRFCSEALSHDHLGTRFKLVDSVRGY